MRYIRTNYYYNQIFPHTFQNKQKLNKQGHTFCTMPLAKGALSIGLADLFVHLFRFGIHVAINSAIDMLIAINGA